MGKGDSPRPLSVSAHDYEARWARTFGYPPSKEVKAEPEYMRRTLEAIDAMNNAPIAPTEGG